MAMKKTDLIKILVEEYGYEKDDIKTLTNAKLQAMADTEVKEAEELEKAKKEAEKPVTRVSSRKSEISDNEEILIMNGSTGAVQYYSQRTNKTWEFTQFGQQDVIEYGELKTIRNRHPRYFKEGYFIVLDPVAQKELDLTELYTNIITPDNEDKIFKMPLDKLGEFIDALPDGQKSSFVNMAQDKYDNGQLDSNKLIKFIEDKFNFSLEDNAPKTDIVSTSEKIGNGMIVVEKVR